MGNPVCVCGGGMWNYFLVVRHTPCDNFLTMPCLTIYHIYLVEPTLTVAASEDDDVVLLGGWGRERERVRERKHAGRG